MSKAMYVAALALVLGSGIHAAGAQQTVDGVLVPSAPITHTRAFAPRSPSAFARNVGPGSTVTGAGPSYTGVIGSGTDYNPRAPAASNLGSGGR